MINKQDYLNAFTQDIDIVRGDTLIFNFEIQGIKGELPDTIIFSVAKHYDDEPLFSSDLNNGISLEDYNVAKDTATYSVEVSPAKTKPLDLGRYYYDLEMRLNDDIYTLMRGRFTLLYEITK